MDPFTTALLGGTSILGGIMGAGASRRAAQEQSQASMMSALLQAQAQQQALQQQQRMFDKAVELQEPFRQGGVQATNRLTTLLGIGQDQAAPGYGSMVTPFSGGDITADPIYQTMLEQGLKTSARQMAARGGQGYLSGSAVRGAQGVASLEGQNAYNRFMDQRQRQYNMLSGMVSPGAGAAQTGAQLATQTGANMANTMIGAGQALGQGIEQAGQARASGYMGTASALQNALQGPTNAMLLAGMSRPTGYAGFGQLPGTLQSGGVLNSIFG